MLDRNNAQGTIWNWVADLEKGDGPDLHNISAKDSNHGSQKSKNKKHHWRTTSERDSEEVGFHSDIESSVSESVFTVDNQTVLCPICMLDKPPPPWGMATVEVIDDN